METQAPRISIPWKIFLPGAAVILVMAACASTLVLGAGKLKASLQAKELTGAGSEARVSFSEDGPQDARLTQINGWVETGTEGAWSLASDGQRISSGHRIRTGDLSSVHLLFNDGSQAFLAANSEISLDELDAGPDKDPRVIIMTQWLGESEHKVAKNEHTGSTYQVRTPTGTGEAKGTVFHVIVTTDQVAHYYVMEGIVAVTNLDMTVLVNAGEVTTIFSDQPPQQPLASIAGQGQVTQTGETWIVAGQTLSVNEDTAIFGDPKVGDWVRFKGRVLEDGTRVANWIVQQSVAPVNRISLVGTVESIGDGEWRVSGQVLLVSDQTEIEAGIGVGDQVVLEGQITPEGNLKAARIQLLDRSLGFPFQFTGIVQEILPESWLISGKPVTIAETTYYPQDTEPGQAVQVLGWIKEDGSWLAGQIVPVGGQQSGFEFTGILESMDSWQAAGIPFETREWTQIEAGLAAGDLVHVQGSLNENGAWVASIIEKVEAGEQTSLVLIGRVISMDPWIVNGISLTLNDETTIEGEITVGMLVRVEVFLREDGLWQIVRIQPLDGDVYSPGCMDIVAVVVGVDGEQLQLLDWPLLTLGEDTQIEGDLTPNSVIRFRLCFGEDQALTILYIVVVQQGDIEVDIPDDQNQGEKVYVCHKPGSKKGGHTIHISRSALPAHIGHGDYEGPCQ